MSAADNCRRCHLDGTELVEMPESGQSKCPVCGRVYTERDHSNMGVTSCQFAMLLALLNTQTNILYRLYQCFEEGTEKTEKTAN